MVGRNAKDTLDVRQIADTDLNVGFLVEAGSLIDRLPFKKDASNRFKGPLAATLIDFVNVVNDGAVKLTLEEIRSPVIFRHGKTARVNIVLEHQIRVLNKFYASCGRQVEAIAQIDDGSDNVWLRDPVGGIFSEFLKMFRPIQGSCWVRFPEIDTRP